MVGLNLSNQPLIPNTPFQKYDEILNLNSVRNGKIIVSTEVRKMEVILRILLGDVFEDNGRIYLSNSKRPIERFA